MIPLLSLVKALETFSASRLFFSCCSWGCFENEDVFVSDLPKPVMRMSTDLQTKETNLRKAILCRLCWEIWIPSPQLLLTQRVHEEEIQNLVICWRNMTLTPRLCNTPFQGWKCHALSLKFSVLPRNDFVLTLCGYLDVLFYNPLVLNFCYWHVVQFWTFYRTLSLSLYSDFSVAYMCLGHAILWGGVGVCNCLLLSEVKTNDSITEIKPYESANWKEKQDMNMTLYFISVLI